ncbi:VapE domain-containing protein [Burkholderia gladioli]|uniref:VapE domain-containing protein n=1 Tax=Burkholderia gladioli TaxID=28095 RepID=UPI00163EADD5|nr:VapE domain-containing protein [Burkholderia gladioli]
MQPQDSKHEHKPIENFKGVGADESGVPPSATSRVPKLDDTDEYDQDWSAKYDESLPSLEEQNGPSPEEQAAQEVVKAKIARGEALKEKQRQKDDEIRHEHKSLESRARAFKRENSFKYVHTQARSIGGGDSVLVAKTTYTNIKIMLDMMFGRVEERLGPHLDEFKGTIVDDNGTVIDDNYYMGELLAACEAAELKELNPGALRNHVSEWARGRRWNSLADRIDARLKENKWDGKPRLRKQLVEMFDAKDSNINRDVGEYFWLSLYCRAVHPGCNAPIVLSLIGGQGVGKSHFGTLINRFLLDNSHAATVPLNLGVSDFNGFLRQITGNSVIASVGEMTGFKTADLNKVKDFITRNSDMMNLKYQPDANQPRGWIVMMDGNSYEGLQRDSTGNRRFFPMFVAQMDDIDGMPTWKGHPARKNLGEEPFCVDFASFESDFWQIMAECRAWMEEKGLSGYDQMVSRVSGAVAAFNDEERSNNRGTVYNPDVDLYLEKAIAESKWRPYSERKGEKRSGPIIWQADLVDAFKAVSRNNNPNIGHITTGVSGLGGVLGKYTGNKSGYFFPGIESIDDLIKRINASDSDSGELGAEVKPYDERRNF